MKNGTAVAAFERTFAEYVGAKYAIALCNGTATLHTALEAMEYEPWQDVAVPPLTMSATTLAVLHAGHNVVYTDIDPDTWLMQSPPADAVAMPVSLYGLTDPSWKRTAAIVDAAQTLAPHSGSGFTSYSFQASKILSTGEGGMLVTNNEELATRAREFSSLGYQMRADQPRIDPAAVKHPEYQRHYRLGWNYRMADAVAMAGMRQLSMADWLLTRRQIAARYYADAVSGYAWITPQAVPAGWSHDYWAYTVALESPDLWEPFTRAVVRHGGEMPYGAWRLTYQEPAFRHLAPDGTCPVAESLQPRLVQGQTNDPAVARANADAWYEAAKEVQG